MPVNSLSSDSIVNGATTTMFILFLLLSLPRRATSIQSEELDTALTILRLRDHALFANAISTSDFLFDLLSANSLTLLAPPDPSLFALDMSQSMPFYLSALRLHAIPLRLSLSELRSLRNGSYVATLLPAHHLLLTKPDGDRNTIELNGARLVLPRVYFGRHIAVYGLAGVLTFAASNLSPPPSPRPVRSGTVPSTVFPVPVPKGLNHTNWTRYFPPFPRIPAFNRPVPFPQIPVNQTVNHTIPFKNPPYTVNSPTHKNTTTGTSPALAPYRISHGSFFDTVRDYSSSPRSSPSEASIFPKTVPMARDVNTQKERMKAIQQLGYLLEKSDVRRSSSVDGEI